MKSVRAIFEEQKRNIRKKYFKNYKYVDDIFDDYYFNGGVLRKKEYDTVFKKGDIVTTSCGFDLGLVKEYCSDEFPEVYSRYTSYEKYSNISIPHFRNSTIHWYKTGINVSLTEWKEICLFFEGVRHEYWKMKREML